MIPSTNPMLARRKVLNGSNLPPGSAFSSSAYTPPRTLKQQPAKPRRFKGRRWLHGALLAFFALLLCAGVALAQTGGGGGPGGGAGGGTGGGSAAGNASGSGNGNGGTGNGAAGGNSNAGAGLGSAATSLGSVGTGGIAAISSQPLPGGGTRYSLSIQTLLLLAALSFLPAALLLMTGFTRIVIVLSLLRSALGLQGSPPNPVLIALALFMTFYVMSPVFDDIYQNAYRPLDTNQITFNVALSRAEKPLKAFMLKQTRQADLALFLKLSNTAAPQVRDPDALPLSVVVPAFVTSELKTAFQIGFMIFLPFLIIDLVVASVLMSMGMMMLSPVLVSLPIKLMLFVLADGWNLLIGSLVASFNS